MPRSLRGGPRQSEPHAPASPEPGGPEGAVPPAVDGAQGVEHAPRREGDDLRRRRHEHPARPGRTRPVVLAARLHVVAEGVPPPAERLAFHERARAAAARGQRRRSAEGEHALRPRIALLVRAPAELAVLVPPPAPDLSARVEGAGEVRPEGDAAHVGEPGHAKDRLRRRRAASARPPASVSQRQADAPQQYTSPASDTAQLMSPLTATSTIFGKPGTCTGGVLEQSVLPRGARLRRDAELSVGVHAEAPDRAADGHHADVAVPTREASHVLGEGDGDRRLAGLRRDVHAPPAKDVPLHDTLRPHVGADQRPARRGRRGCDARERRRRPGAPASASGGGALPASSA